MIHNVGDLALIIALWSALILIWLELRLIRSNIEKMNDEKENKGS